MAGQKQKGRGARALGLAAAWALVLAGFVFYLVNLASGDWAYGSLGATGVSLIWLTLFSLLYYATPRRRRARSEGTEPTLETLVRLALADDVAHKGMSSALSSRPEQAPLTRLECDLSDWGFAYGVAWALAKRRHPDEPDELVAERALWAARAVFGEYCAGQDWTQPLADREPAADLQGLHR